MIPSAKCKARATGVGVLVAVLAGASPVSAQGDPAAAEVLFKSALALVDRGDFAAGCPKFEASFALNASASTLLNIARCHEHDGKIATAWADYGRAIVLNRETKGAERQKKLLSLARKGSSDLERRLPRLRVVAADPPAGLKVARDDTDLPAGALGEPLPVDPGPHRVVATAPGYLDQSVPVVLEEGKTATVEITLHRPNVERAPSPVPAWAWITGAGGLVLGGLAGYFLADDLAAIKALRANCQNNAAGTYCNPGYDYAADNARKDRGFGLAVGLGGASVIALGVASTGIVRSRPARAPATATAITVAPWGGPGGAGAVLRGGF
jgi:hypothetical protein